MTLRSVLFSAVTLAVVACGTAPPPPASTGSPNSGKEAGAIPAAERPAPADLEAPAGADERESGVKSGEADTGYSAGAPTPLAAPPPTAGLERAPAPEPAPKDGDEARKAPTARPSQREPEPDLRPGLATLWGEDRGSSIRFTSFFRETPTRPFAVTRVFYNDRDGIRAMAQASGRSNVSDGGRREGEGFVTLRLLDENGAPLPTFEVASRQYVIGEAGGRYSLEIQNNTDARMEAVATVDGLDVIDGKPGSFENRGYLVDPFGRLTIEGFRRSMDTVAAFRFGSVRDSYAAQKGNARNVGLVGVALFHERGSQPRAMSDEVRRRHDADAFPGRFAQPPSGH